MTKAATAQLRAIGHSGFGFLSSLVIRHWLFNDLLKSGSWSQCALKSVGALHECHSTLDQLYTRAPAAWLAELFSMKTSASGSKISRRRFIAAAAAAVAAPTFIPASALGKDGQPAPSERIVVGRAGVQPEHAHGEIATSAQAGCLPNADQHP